MLAARWPTSTSRPTSWSRRSGRRAEPPAEALARRLNGVLDPDVRVLRVGEAPEGFDARFSALWRRYAYRIADRPEHVDPLARGQVVAWRRELDLEAMNEAAAGLLGEHDFAAFCRRREGATTVRALLELHWERVDGVAVATVRADAFCHSMVRALTGCLVVVGEGRREPGWAAQVLSARAARPRRQGDARPRADPGGGRLPGRRGARRAGPGDPGDAFGLHLVAAGAPAGRGEEAATKGALYPDHVVGGEPLGRALGALAPAGDVDDVDLAAGAGADRDGARPPPGR